jgi:hypothetical protein
MGKTKRSYSTCFPFLSGWRVARTSARSKSVGEIPYDNGLLADGHAALWFRLAKLATNGRVTLWEQWGACR